ncbi:hypothetical protein TNCV_708941 [Trichonephila clavipes]|nr:hypothetical protein TNCV_708941 [Trichonephila clavipes]
MIPNLPNTITDVKHLFQYVIENDLKKNSKYIHCHSNFVNDTILCWESMMIEEIQSQKDKSSASNFLKELKIFLKWSKH